MDEVIQQLEVQRAEDLVGVAAGLVQRVSSDQARVAQQDIDGDAFELDAQRLDLRGIRDVHALDAHLGILRRQLRQLLGCRAAAVSSDDRPSASRILLGKLQTDPLIGPRDQDGLSHGWQ